MRVKSFVHISLLCVLLCVPASASAADVVLGMSASFTGSTRGLGIELYRGARAYFDYMNNNGGVNGHTVSIRHMDDGYSPLPAIRNTVDLVERDKVFALFNYVGTPTTTRVLPLLKRYESRDMLLLFPLTGAQVLRQPPYNEYVFNMRASYFDETKALVDNFINANRNRIAVFYQADAYGRSGWEGVRRALLGHRLVIVGEATYRRGVSFEVSMEKQVEAILGAHPDAIVAVGASEACAAFVRDLRQQGSDVPVATLSFSNCEYLSSLLDGESIVQGDIGLACSQAVPDPRRSSVPATREFRKVMDSFDPGVPDGIDAGDYAAPRYSRIAFEGYLNAKVFATALARVQSPLSRKGLRHALEQLRDVDIGLGESVSFYPGQHQAFRRTYLYMDNAKGLEQVEGFERWLK